MTATVRAAARAVALALGLAALASAQLPKGSNGTYSTPSTPKPTDGVMPLFMATAPKLDRAHKNKLLLEAPCGQFCKYVIWQIRALGEKAWRAGEAETHANFPDTFYVRSLRPDTSYELRALLKPPLRRAYTGDDVPTLQATTCPENPPPVSNLRAQSAGPGWLDLRWTPPPKERCKSHLYYQVRYAPHGHYFSPWRQFGFFRSERWVHFRPTHPCAAWPAEFCALLTDEVKAGDQHVVEVRVSRFDELSPALSESRKVIVRADTGCVVNDSCGVIGAAPVSASASPSPPSANATRASDEVDVDDPDMATTQSPSESPSQWSEDVQVTTKAPVGEAAEQRARDRTGGGAGGETALGRVGAVFLALLLLACAALPAAYLYGKRRGAREAVELNMVPAWRRRMGDGITQPVLNDECVNEEGDDEDNGVEERRLQMDQHGRFSWANLLPRDD